MLEQSLHGHSEPVPADFTERMLSRVREAEEQRILARVVLQERAALAACIVLGAAAIIAAAVFPDAVGAVFRSITAGFTEHGSALIDKIGQTKETVSSEWQFYTVLAGVFGLAVYGLVDLLVGDRLRIA